MDLILTLDHSNATPAPGATLNYHLRVAHFDGDIVPNIHLVATFPAPLTNVSWHCTPSQGSSCSPESGTADIDGAGDIDAMIRLDAGVSVAYAVTATVAGNAPAGATIGVTATVTPPIGINDSNGGNNRASDVTSVVFTQCAPRPSVSHRVTPAGPAASSSPWKRSGIRIR